MMAVLPPQHQEFARLLQQHSGPSPGDAAGLEGGIDTESYIRHVEGLVAQYFQRLQQLSGDPSHSVLAGGPYPAAEPTEVAAAAAPWPSPRPAAAGDDVEAEATGAGAAVLMQLHGDVAPPRRPSGAPRWPETPSSPPPQPAAPPALGLGPGGWQDLSASRLSDEDHLTDPRGSALFQRLMQWRARTDTETAQRQREAQRQETAECSFQPRVNGKPMARSQVPATTRLYTIGRERQREREETCRQHDDWKVWSQCTFQPQTNAELNRALQAKPKYNRPTTPRLSPGPAEDTSQCTFRPAVNALAQEFRQAQSYLELPAHERLFAESKKPAPTPWACQRKGPGPADQSPGKRKYYQQLHARAEEEIVSLEHMIASAAKALGRPAPASAAAAAPSPRGSPARCLPRSPPTRRSPRPAVPRPPPEVWHAADRALFTDGEGNFYADLPALQGALAADVVLDPGAELFARLAPPPAWRYDPLRYEVDGRVVDTDYESSEGEGAGGSPASPRSPRPTPDGVVDFAAFLERQNVHEQKRREELEKLRTEAEGPHQPRLNRKSVKLLQKATQESDFLTRQHGHQRRHAKELHQLTKDVAKDLTFEPAINPKSKALPARGPADFVFKDVERLEKKKAKLVKYYTEQSSLDTTFHPKVNDASPGRGRPTGRLHFAEGLKGYARFLKAQEERRDSHRQAALKKQEREELKHCTFQPETVELPAYIKRLAQSLSALRDSVATSADHSG